MPFLSQFLLRGFHRCHGLIAKTSYCGHSTVKPQHWSTWWMSDRNESSHGFTSFKFMHGGPVRGEKWCGHCSHCLSRFYIPPLFLKLVICCLAAFCQNAWESRVNICGLTGMNPIRLFCDCRGFLCIHHSIYHFNRPQHSQEAQFNLVSIFCSSCYMSTSDSKLVTLHCYSIQSSCIPSESLGE